METSALAVGATDLLAPRIRELLYLGLAMQSVLVLERAILHKLKLVRRIAAILLGCVVLLLALSALKGNLLYWTFLL